ATHQARVDRLLGLVGLRGWRRRQRRDRIARQDIEAWHRLAEGRDTESRTRWQIGRNGVNLIATATATAATAATARPRAAFRGGRTEGIAHKWDQCTAGRGEQPPLHDLPTRVLRRALLGLQCICWLGPFRMRRSCSGFAAFHGTLPDCGYVEALATGT